MVSLLGWYSSVPAGPILGAGSASGSTVDPFGGLPAYGIDQSELSANYVSGVTDFDVFAATTTAANAGSIVPNLIGIGALPGFFEFDLGSVFNIDGLGIWNQFGTAALNTFTIETSLLADFSMSMTSGVLSMSQFGGAQDINADVFLFGARDTQFIRINALTNAGFARATRINEIAFRQSSVSERSVREPSSPVLSVPEPGTITLIGLGLAGLGFARRRA